MNSWEIIRFFDIPSIYEIFVFRIKANVPPAWMQPNNNRQPTTLYENMSNLFSFGVHIFLSFFFGPKFFSPSTKSEQTFIIAYTFVKLIPAALIRFRCISFVVKKRIVHLQHSRIMSKAYYYYNLLRRMPGSGLDAGSCMVWCMPANTLNKDFLITFYWKSFFDYISFVGLVVSCRVVVLRCDEKKLIFSLFSSSCEHCEQLREMASQYFAPYCVYCASFLFTA